ncbi:MAG TPA: alkaline phosphatase family protein [Thermoanaerobaculia bacterium]
MAQRVVLVSFDGLGADALATHGPLPAFARIANEGTWVRRMVPVTPSVTSTAHAAILTGTTPDVNGIVANRFHEPGTPWNVVTKGMEAEIDGETLLDAARRQGKRVGCILFPTIDGRTPRRSADWGLAFTMPTEEARLIHFRRADFKEEWVPPTWTARPSRRVSYSPIMRARFEWSATDVDLVAYDSTNDGARNYDLLLVENGETELPLDERRWFPLTRRIDGVLHGAWSKILQFDPALANVTLYLGATARNDAYPESFRQWLDDEVGVWPGVPNEALAAEWLAGNDGIDAETFLEQSDRLSAFLTRATALAIERMPFDLLLAYQPGIDEAEHQFLVVLDSQPNATPRNRAAGERVRRASYQAADRALTAIVAALDPARDALVVTGDHGVAPIDVEVRPNRLLQEWGFAPRWKAFASGNVAHLYRTEGDDDRDAVVKKLTASGYFERVVAPPANAPRHQNAGDIVAFAHPHIALTAAETGDAVVKPDYYGQHGAISTHPELHTVFGAWGAGVARMTFESAQQTEVAGYVSRLLGIEAPRPPS